MSPLPPPPRKLPFLILALCLPLAAQQEYGFDRAPIRYSDTPARTAVEEVEKSLADGTLRLEGPPLRQLEVVLEKLDIPPSSQVLVFSKTSVQSDLIGPANPRAIYFSDTEYVGYVPGGRMELASQDAALGPVFYLFDPADHPPRRPRFQRDHDCLRCHGTFFTDRVPGVFVRSVFPDQDGHLVRGSPSTVVDHTVPLRDRWGGWYVTGRHGGSLHLGNIFAAEGDDEPVHDPESGANLLSLEGRFPTANYLRPGSDIVALMVLEHQCSAQSALTRAAYATREALAQQQREDPATEPEHLSGHLLERVRSEAERLVETLLFCGEARLPREGIQGDAEFAREFAAKAPRSRDGRSLKDLDLSTRLFRHRCSYMIHTPAFAALPEPLKSRVLSRLREILVAGEGGERYQHLAPEERQQIVSILADTLPDWAAAGGAAEVPQPSAQRQ